MDYVGTFVEDGVVIIPDALSTAVMNELSIECNELRNQVGTSCVIEPTTSLDLHARQQICSAEEYAAVRKSHLRHPHDTNDIIEFFFEKSNPIHKLLDEIFGGVYYFYNEQYILKPPRKGEFSWHRDSDNAGTDTAFISCWFALSDEITAENGGLLFQTYNNEKKLVENIKKGTMVLFAHDVLHCSSTNTSSDWRCAYMIQFSQQPMTFKDNKHIAFAVPIY